MTDADTITVVLLRVLVATVVSIVLWLSLIAVGLQP